MAGSCTLEGAAGGASRSVMMLISVAVIEAARLAKKKKKKKKKKPVRLAMWNQSVTRHRIHLFESLARISVAASVNSEEGNVHWRKYGTTW